MKASLSLLSIAAAALMAGGCGDDNDDTNGPTPETTSFFVTSTGNATGNLGGLSGADAKCQSLASSVNLGRRTWHAYLSVEHDPSNGNNAADARSRIGSGPWRNSAGVVVAQNVNDLHARSGDAAVFLDERGQRINGPRSGAAPPGRDTN